MQSIAGFPQGFRKETARRRKDAICTLKIKQRFITRRGLSVSEARDFDFVLSEDGSREASKTLKIQLSFGRGAREKFRAVIRAETNTVILDA